MFGVDFVGMSWWTSRLAHVTADNPATALHSILKSVRSSGGHSVATGWQQALGCESDSEDFPGRHSEVVNLFRQVEQYLRSLPEQDEDRELYLKYCPAWYRAITFRDSWRSSGQPAASIIDNSALDQLRGLGRLLHRTMPSSLSDDATSALRDGLKIWRDLLAESGVRPEVVERIKAQVDLIDWLLENESTFGSEPIVRESRNLVGMGIEVLQAVPAKAKTVGLALGFLVYMLSLVHQGVDQTVGILEGLNSTRTQYEQLISPPEQLGNSEFEVLDAEVVDVKSID